jgi:hypothetical protein
MTRPYSWISCPREPLTMATKCHYRQRKDVPLGMLYVAETEALVVRGESQHALVKLQIPMCQENLRKDLVTTFILSTAARSSFSGRIDGPRAE